MNQSRAVGVVIFAVSVCSLAGWAQASVLDLGPEEFVQANGVDIQVPGYSVPSFVDWNNDLLKDLIVGEGGGSGDAKVRVYLNVGTEAEPQFGESFYAQSNGQDLACPAQGCLGCFPRVVYWDQDERKDLLVGLADGTVRIYVNTATDEDPSFDAGQTLTVGSSQDWDLSVGRRATPTLVDWNEDGMLDLVVGALDGLIHFYENCGCDGPVPPHFYFSSPEGEFAQLNGFDLEVPGRRSSPVVMDLDGDDRPDLLTGNTDGWLLFYKNTSPRYPHAFAQPERLTSEGVPIDLPGTPRSRPFVCYWTGDGHFGPPDGYWDVLVGSGDGKVRLYRGTPQLGDLNADGGIDFADFALLAEAWHVPLGAEGSPADLNGDGIVDARDLDLFIDLWLADSP